MYTFQKPKNIQFDPQVLYMCMPQHLHPSACNLNLHPWFIQQRQIKRSQTLTLPSRTPHVEGVPRRFLTRRVPLLQHVIEHWHVAMQLVAYKGGQVTLT